MTAVSKRKCLLQADRQSKPSVFMEAGGRKVWGDDEEEPHASGPMV